MHYIFNSKKYILSKLASFNSKFYLFQDVRKVKIMAIVHKKTINQSSSIALTAAVDDDCEDQCTVFNSTKVKTWAHEQTTSRKGKDTVVPIISSTT